MITFTTIGLRRVLAATLAASLPAFSFGQSDLGAISGKAEKRLETAIQELAELRESIAEKKIPLATELREIEQIVEEKRSEQRSLQRQRDNSGLELSSLETQLSAREDEISYISNLLLDYSNRLNASIHPSEVQLYGDDLLEILNASEKSGISRDDLIEKRLSAIGMGLERVKDNAAGHSFGGKAILADGSFVDGQFAFLGPIAFFASSDGKSAGLAERGSSLEPRLLVFDPEATPAIAEFVKQGEGSVPLDTSGGRATAISATKESLIEHIGKGGLWMYPILGFAFLSLAIAAFKFLELSKYKLLPKEVVFEVLSKLYKGDKAGAERVAKENGGAESKMLVVGIKNSHLPKELLDEIMFENLLEEKPKLERGLSFISVTAAVAPLLGLLGTVTGMINTFKLITLFGTGDAKSLSSGISEALITTEFGLVVAIPSLLLSAFLSRKANSMIAKMEKTSITFVNGIAAHAAPNVVEFEKRMAGGAKA
ncbi:MotA/TolQ/ExbB proton channel family protein [Pelagicoccus sp. SDUM812003]|uniref:MotA/TolQ/ExbB proton channel family protein n=1 Tax=Pelagicoccus sp. SDUM812003 TaxID=3041267 RepID=UPI00280D337F|nr:MotA/TolQ/ExbB proton channel family protein [Pelagicoccus sp. SDUM812003]MDQ8204697.1 MotA/TolQ/ExbB proton channel family protein [Pelagicoccus sp. SDUM812003]